MRIRQTQNSILLFMNNVIPKYPLFIQPVIEILLSCLNGGFK